MISLVILILLYQDSMVQEEWGNVVAPIIQFMVFPKSDINGVLDLLIIALAFQNGQIGIIFILISLHHRLIKSKLFMVSGGK